MTQNQDGMRVIFLVRVGFEVEGVAGPHRRDHPGLHLRERPRDGLGVEKQEGERWVGEVEQLVLVQIVDAWGQYRLTCRSTTYGQSRNAYDALLLISMNRRPRLAGAGHLLARRQSV